MTIAPSLFDLAPQPAKAPSAPLAGRGIPLRHPQRQDVDALMYALESGHKHPACVAATGYGKGALIAETAGRLMPNGKVVCLVDREHLVYQLADEIERHLRIDVGRVADGKCTGLTFPVVVSTVQAMFTAGRDGRPLYEYPQFRDTRAVLADECFPAGTLIDGIPIEEIRVGDLVRSFNHATALREWRRVTHTFRRPARTLATVHFASGRKVQCTACHPFYSHTLRHYVPAAALTVGTEVIVNELHAASLSTQEMRSLRGGISSDQRSHDVLAGVHEDRDGAAPSATGRDPSVPLVRRACDMRERETAHGEKWPGVLLKNLQRGLRRIGRKTYDGDCRQDIRIGDDEIQQPDARSEHAGESFEHSEINRSWSEGPRRQRPSAHGARTIDERRGGMADAGDRSYEGQPSRLPKPLQTGRRELGYESCDRDRRALALFVDPEKSGSEERGFLALDRVDRVEIHEPTSDGRFGGLCPGGFVYNIEVECNHNYFAGGVLVHNCHKFFAPCFRSVPDYFVGKCNSVVVGFSATPVASNGDRWRDFFDWTPAAPGPCMRTVGWCIDNGYLVPLRQAFIRIDLRLDELYGQLDGADDEADDGDGSRAGSSIIMDLLTDKGEQAAARFASGVVEAIGDRHSMVFTPPRTRGNPMMPAKVVASWLNAAGLPSDAVWGNRPDKAAVLARFVRGRPQALTNCSLLTEGFNAPSVSAAFVCRLVKSWRLITQMIGRAMRPAPECIADLNRLDAPDDAAARRSVIAASGKPDALIADLVGLDGHILRASAIDVLYADESQDVRDEMARRAFAKPKARPDDDAPAVDDAERDAARDALARKQSEQLAEMARRRAMRGGLPADVSITYGDGGGEALPAVPVPRQQATLGERAVFVAMAVAATRYSPADAKLIAETKPRNQVRGMTWGFKKKLDKERARPNWNAARQAYPDWRPAA